jgi:tetratricopeptide (TPR) repeat protein
MADLMRALIQVKDPLTLFAFVSLVFLVAFRTKKVPELFFGLAKEKLTKERFSQLLHRFMLYGFVAFVLLCASAVTGQVLALKTQAKPITLDDLRSELKNINLPDAQKQTALHAYSEGIVYIQQRDFDRAIQSLQNSIGQVPTLSAQYTLAYLYQKKGDTENAKTHAAAAQSIANLNGDSLAQVRLQQLAASPGGSAAQKSSMVGDKSPLPEGGKTPEDAPWISPGLYVLNSQLGSDVYWYYKMRVKVGETVVVDFKTSDTGIYAGASIYDANAVLKASGRLVASRSELSTIRWGPPADTVLYISIGSSFGANATTLYRISIQ